GLPGRLCYIIIAGISNVPLTIQSDRKSFPCHQTAHPALCLHWIPLFHVTVNCNLERLHFLDKRHFSICAVAAFSSDLELDIKNGKHTACNFWHLCHYLS